MIIQENGEQVTAPAQNAIIGDFSERGSRITFKGTGNILFCEDGARLENCNIAFCSDNAVIYLAANTKHWNKLKIDAWRDTTIYVGRNNYFNNTLSAIVSERKNLIIGGDGVFSFGIWLRTADPHILYDVETKARINPSRSILIGDHVWLGQNATILKGTSIGSGSVLAAGAVIAGKNAGSNTVWGGNPAQMIKQGVFFSGASVHNYTEKQTKESMQFKKKDYIYDEDRHTRTIESIDRMLLGRSPEERVDLLKELNADTAKNRFFVPLIKPQTKQKGWFGRRG